MLGKDSHAFSLFFSLSGPSEITALAPFALSQYFQDLICTIAYQALSSTQPAYLNSMLAPARHSRQLRSVSSCSLYIPRVKTKTGTRAFSVAAPTVWTSLPASVKLQWYTVSFRRCLKPISLMLHVLLNFLVPSSTRLRLAHCLRLRDCVNNWDCRARHRAWFSRILAYRKSVLLLLLWHTFPSVLHCITRGYTLLIVVPPRSFCNKNLVLPNKFSVPLIAAPTTYCLLLTNCCN